MQDQVKLVPYDKPPSGYNYCWHVYLHDQRAGYVRIGVDQGHPDHTKQWIDIHINANFRGKGVGTEAYRQACELSGLDTVYAVMRKFNIASQKAATKAGFVVITDEYVHPQLAMMWSKS